MTEPYESDVEVVTDHPLFRRKLLENLNSPEQLDQLMTVTSPQSWLALATIGVVLALTLGWSLFSRVESTIPGSGIIVTAPDRGQEALKAVFYVSMRDGERIRARQWAKLALRSFRQEEYGLLWGHVTTVSRSAVTTEQMSAVLQNDALVQSLVSAGQIVEVQAELIRSDSASGYLWTSANGPPVPIMPNTPATAYVIVDQQRPIELLWSR